MTSHLIRRLASLDREIRVLETELAHARDQFAVQQAALEESRLRVLVAETPVADEDHQRTADTHRVLEQSVARLERALGELREQRRRLERAELARRPVGS